MWHEQTHNPTALQELYSDTSGLDEVVLQEAQIDLQLRRVRLRLELARFPDKPARKWNTTDNAVQVTLDCWLSDTAGDVDIRLTSSVQECPGRFSITRDGDLLGIAFDGKDAMLRARCYMVRIDRISAYQRG